jgi:hypothetical protein
MQRTFTLNHEIHETHNSDFVYFVVLGVVSTVPWHFAAGRNSNPGSTECPRIYELADDSRLPGRDLVDARAPALDRERRGACSNPRARGLSDYESENYFSARVALQAALPALVLAVPSMAAPFTRPV